MRDEEGGRVSGRRCTSVFKTSEPSSSPPPPPHPEERERNGFLATPTLDVSAASGRKTLNALLSCQHPDQNTGKIVACFITGDNKSLFIHNGTKHSSDTSFIVEKTHSTHSFLNVRQRHS